MSIETGRRTARRKPRTPNAVFTLDAEIRTADRRAGDGAAAVEAAAEHAAARRGLKTSAGFRWNAGGERRRASIEIAVYPAAGGRPTAGEPVVTLRGPAPAEVAKFARACEEGAVDGPAPPFAFRLNLRAGRIAPARSAVR